MPVIVSIQALRAIAALAVAVSHISEWGEWLAGNRNADSPLYALASGVDLFFVISGFVMVYSSEPLFARPGGSTLFFIRRVARIVPLYWLTTALTIIFEQKQFGLYSLIGSYFFIPYRTGEEIAPLQGVGWTLNYEMFFYALFAIFLMFPRRIAVPALSTVLVAIVVLGSIVSPAISPLHFWSDPIVLEFVMGMALAGLYRSGFTLRPSLCLTLIAAGAMAVLFSTPGQLSPERWLVWGIPAVMIVAGAVLGERHEDRGQVARFAVLLGDASYAIYLTHTLFNPAIFYFWNRGLNHLPKTAVLGGALILCLAISVLIHQLVERRVTRFVARRLTRVIAWRYRALAAVLRDGRTSGRIVVDPPAQKNATPTAPLKL